MSRRLMIVSVALLISFAAAFARARDPWNSPSNFPYRDSDAYKFIKIITAPIASVSDTDLDLVAADNDPSLAMAAEWEKLQRTISPKASCPSRQAIDRFLCHVENRLSITVPKAWKDGVKMFGADNPAEKQTSENLDEHSETSWSEKQEKYEIAVENKHVVLRAAGLRWIAPDDAIGETSEVSVTSSGDRVFVGIVNFGDLKLFAVDRKSQKTLWSQIVCTNTAGVCLNGLLIQHAAVRTYEDRVFIYGRNIDLCFAGFRMADGKELVRFSTSKSDCLWKERDGRRAVPWNALILPAVQTDPNLFEIDSRLLINELRLTKVDGVSAGGPWVGVIQNSITKQIVAKGQRIVPLLCDRLHADDLALDEAIWIMFCLSDLEADSAEESVAQLKRELVSRQRFPDRDWTLDQLIDAYYATADLRGLAR